MCSKGVKIHRELREPIGSRIASHWHRLGQAQSWMRSSDATTRLCRMIEGIGLNVEPEKCGLLSSRCPGDDPMNEEYCLGLNNA